MLSVGRRGDLLDNTRRESAEQHLCRSEYKLDVIVFAAGFGAMTGPLERPIWLGQDNRMSTPLRQRVVGSLSLRVRGRSSVQRDCLGALVSIRRLPD